MEKVVFEEWSKDKEMGTLVSIIMEAILTSGRLTPQGSFT